jgi:hypothetical protein
LENGVTVEVDSAGSTGGTFPQTYREPTRAGRHYPGFHGVDGLVSTRRTAGVDLIEATGFRRFPPRLPEQQFFYPVVNEEYAAQIARNWNTKDESSGWTGYVLRFKISSEFLAQYPTRMVGSAIHREYWIPAAKLEEFNDHIDGVIEAIACFRGKDRVGG